MKYEMKDLGYKRTPTSAMMRVEMPDGSLWDVPVQAVVDSRDEYYMYDKENTVGLIRAGKMSPTEIKDWASSDMNWSDVEMFATRASCVAKEHDYQCGWVHGNKTILKTV